MEKRKSFIFCTDWYKPMSALPPKVKLELYDAIEVYVTTGEVPSDLSQLAKMAFRFMKRWIEEENKHLFYGKKNNRKERLS